MTFSKHRGGGIKAPMSPPPKYLRGTIPHVPPKSPPLNKWLYLHISLSPITIIISNFYCIYYMKNAGVDNCPEVETA